MVFYKKCEICSSKISKLNSYIFNEEFDIYTLKCESCGANYQLRERFFSGIFSDITGILYFILCFGAGFYYANKISSNTTIQVLFIIFVFIVLFTIIDFIEELIIRFITGKYILIKEKKEVKPELNLVKQIRIRIKNIIQRNRYEK